MNKLAAGLALGLLTNVASFGPASLAFAEESKQQTQAHASAANPHATSPHQNAYEAGTPPEAKKGWNFREAATIPIQSGGRIKPLDSYAREVVLYLTGSRSYKGWDPVELLISWLVDFRRWEEVPFIQVNHDDVRRQLGLDEKQRRFSLRQLYNDSYLAQYADSINRGGSQVSAPGAVQASTRQDPREKELKSLLDRIGMFRSLVSGDAWTLIPGSDPAHPWTSLAAAKAGGKGEFVRGQFAAMMVAYQMGEREAFERTARMTRAAVQAEILTWSESSERMLKMEVLYNRAHPFMVAWVLYLFAALTWLATLWSPSARNKPWVKYVAFSFTGLGFLAHVGGFTLRCLIAGRPPVTNMYESIVWVSLGALVFSGILYLLNRQAILYVVGCTVAMLTLIVADAAPSVMDPSIHPLVPVLRSNYWLTIHVLTITLGYAAFALSLGLGNVALYQYLREGRQGVAAKIAGLNQLTYRAVQFGVVLLAAGTILGGVWADYSWGRFWGWDPKEVWALIALMGYLTILHARYTGWMGQFGFAAWSVISFLLVVMAWYGVNFVLGAGLHSYGFASGGQGWVALFAAVQLLYVGAIWLWRQRGRKPNGRALAPS